MPGRWPRCWLSEDSMGAYCTPFSNDHDCCCSAWLLAIDDDTIEEMLSELVLLELGFGTRKLALSRCAWSVVDGGSCDACWCTFEYIAFDGELFSEPSTWPVLAGLSVGRQETLL